MTDPVEHSTSTHVDDDNEASLMEAVELVEKDCYESQGQTNNVCLDTTGKYFCLPCNRSLSGKDAFYRHTLSELHFKRTLSEEVEAEKKGKRKPKKTYKRPLCSSDDSKAKKTTNFFPPPKVKEQLVQSCPCCKANIPDGCFGKHLVSHFHYHRSMNHPDHNSLILSHLHEIVKQAPFQCLLCKFYCNFSGTFLDHWKSQHQSQNLLGQDQRLWCSTCRVTTQSEAQMLKHLLDANHLEIETMINRSVPIKIQLIQLRHCQFCQKKFRLNVSLKLHMASQHPNKQNLSQQRERNTTHRKISSWGARPKFAWAP